MPPGPRPTPAPDIPCFELRGITWERIQVALRLRATGAAAQGVDPAGLRLRLDRDPRSVAEPMRTWADGDDLVARFNVMHGPDRMPLADGRWSVGVVDAGSGGVSPLRLAEGSALPRDESGVLFRLAEGDYAVAPALTAAGGLAFDVLLSPVPGGEAASRDGGDEDGRAARPTNMSGPGRRARVFLFRALHRVLRLIARRNGRRILFSSDSRSGLGGNLAVVHDRMVERGLDAAYELRTLFRPSIVARRSFVDRLRLPWLLARADVVILDDYQPVIYTIDDPNVRIIQLWHASGAFKTVGYSRVGKPGGPSPYSRGHKNYSAAIVSSEHDVPFYAEAFGVREDRIIPTGIPRMDRLFDERLGAEAHARAVQAFPVARDRFTILFAPTFRGGARDASYDAGLIDFAALHALAVEKDAVVIFKLHPFVLEALRIPPEYGDRLIDATRTKLDVNDLLFAVDLLVTDYSSIVFEFSVFDKPMLFFAYDLEAYVAERDFYVPFEAFVPGRIVRTFEELVDAIRRDDCEVEKVAPFAARHFAHLDAGSTDRVIDLAIGR